MVEIPGLAACIDRYEAALDEHGVAIPAVDRRPASAVSFEDAARACRLAGYRLCRGEEWTRACAGEEGRAFPYGAQYEPGRCNTAEADSDLSAIEVAPSGSFRRCVTPEGVFDLSGNVGEWTDQPDATGTLRELRGGAARNGESGVRCVLDDRAFQPTNEAWEGQGFRCCADRRGPR
jgi:formylglycine-generating enzyme required for sulfatase activity